MQTYFQPYRDRFDQVKELLAQFHQRDAGDLFAKRHPLDKAKDVLNGLKSDTQSIISGKRTLTPFIWPVFIASERWLSIIQQEIKLLEGTAELAVNLLNSQADLIKQDEVLLRFRIINKGRVPADKVMVTIAQDSGFAVCGDDSHQTGFISPFTPFEFFFKICPQANQFTLSLSINYTENMTPKIISHQEPINLLDIQETFKELDNPYNFGSLTSALSRSDMSMFYGRQDDVERIRRGLIVNDQSLMIIYGQRRTGKSCLLRYLEFNRLGQADLDIAYLDLQSLSSDRQFFRAVIRALKPDFDQTISSFDAFEETLNPLLSRRKSPLLLMIDEFENCLTDSFQYETLTDSSAFLKRLRALIQHQPGLKFILSGADDLKKMIADYKNPLFNAGQTHLVSFLTEKDGHELITKPLAGQVTYTSQAIADIQAVTYNHPYYIQLICSNLVFILNEKRKSTVTVTEVNEAIESARETSNEMFSYVWQITNRDAHLALAIIAREMNDLSPWVSLDRIEGVIEGLAINFEADVLEGPLSALLNKDLIKERDSGLEYKIAMRLLDDWIKRYKPLKRVLKEFKK